MGMTFFNLFQYSKRSIHFTVLVVLSTRQPFMDLNVSFFINKEDIWSSVCPKSTKRAFGTLFSLSDFVRFRELSNRIELPKTRRWFTLDAKRGTDTLRFQNI